MALAYLATWRTWQIGCIVFPMLLQYVVKRLELPWIDNSRESHNQKSIYTCGWSSAEKQSYNFYTNSLNLNHNWWGIHFSIKWGFTKTIL